MFSKHNTPRRTIVFAIAAVALLALLPSAFASTVLQLDVQSLVANSDQIVVGQVANIESYVESDGRVYTAITIDVQESLKGQPDEQLTIRQIGGRTDDLATIVPGMPDFKPQEEVILFLELHDIPTQLPNRDQIKGQKIPVITGMAQGKFSVAIGPDDKTRFVVPHLGDLHQLPPPNKPATIQKPSQTPPALKNIDTSKLRKINDNALYTEVVEINAFKQKIQDVINEQTTQ